MAWGNSRGGRKVYIKLLEQVVRTWAPRDKWLLVTDTTRSHARVTSMEDQQESSSKFPVPQYRSTQVSLNLELSDSRILRSRHPSHLSPISRSLYLDRSYRPSHMQMTRFDTHPRRQRTPRWRHRCWPLRANKVSTVAAYRLQYGATVMGSSFSWRERLGTTVPRRSTRLRLVSIPH